MTTTPELSVCLEAMPLIAILRGITPAEALPVADILYEEGFRIVEVPLNSPEPFESIRLITEAYGDRMVTGAGTVLTAENVGKVFKAGGSLIVAPNFDLDVVKTAKALGMYCCPGIQTPSEAFAALKAGADAIKVFPGEACPPAVIKAIRAVLPKDVKLVPVGGVSEKNMPEYWKASANGFGIGSNLYKAGKSLDEIRASAKALVACALEFMRS